MTTGLRHLAVLVLSSLIFQVPVFAQKWALSSNAVDWAALATINLEASFAPARQWSVTASAKYNPFTYHTSSKQFQARQQTYSLGVRFWPWHCYSGWWVAAKAQYQEYNMGGIFSARTEEGDRAGAGIAAGYSLMLHPHWNLDFGAGLWAGRKWYSVYSCPRCGMMLGQGKKGFVAPNDITIAVVYVF